MNTDCIKDSARLILARYAIKNKLIDLNQEGKADRGQFDRWLENLDLIDAINIVNEGRFER